MWETFERLYDPNGDIYFRLVDVANTLEISRSSDLLQIQKGFVKNESPKNRGTLDPKGVVKLYTPTKGGTQELAFISEPNLYRVISLKIKTSFASIKKWKRTIPMVVVRANITKHKPFQMRLSN